MPIIERARETDPLRRLMDKLKMYEHRAGYRRLFICCSSCHKSYPWL